MDTTWSKNKINQNKTLCNIKVLQINKLFIQYIGISIKLQSLKLPNKLNVHLLQVTAFIICPLIISSNKIEILK